jgi:hypothetical protein
LTHGQRCDLDASALLLQQAVRVCASTMSTSSPLFTIV